jgi:hypothetical protein
MISPNVVLYSYRRPELTNNAIERILQWPNLRKLLVSIDGVRHDASESEKNWRTETIRIAENHAALDSRVEPCVWNTNTGLTDHAVRIMSKSFETSTGLIALEEDNQIGFAGLDFLCESIQNRERPEISTAFTSQSHDFSGLTARFTFFPEQWSTALTYQVFEQFLRNWSDKKVSRQNVSEALGPIFGSKRFFLEIVTEKWFRMFKASIADPSYGDALMAYTAMSLGISYRVPMKSLVVDIGHTDSRGLHPRQSSNFEGSHQYSNLSVNGFNYCTTCERSTSGIKGTGIRQTLEFVGRKTSNLLLNGGVQPQK